MKYVFYEQDDVERDLIVNVLEKYCVPYKINTNRHSHMFGDDFDYDIIVDLDPDKIEWVKEKVQERINLENCFDMRTVNHPVLKDEKEPAKTNTTLFEDIFKPNLGIDISLLDKERKKNKSIVEEIDEMFENKIKPNMDKLDKDNVINFMKESGLADKLKDSISNAFGIGNPDEMKNQLQNDLQKYFHNKIHDMLPDMDNVLEQFGKDGKEITYNELPEQMKIDLEKQYGHKMLTSNRCKFIRSKNGIAVFIDASED